MTMTHDGFFEFGDDSSTAGFRCKMVEIYNWGTFHNKVVKFSLDGKNALLTGDIGSGKSTLIDAITTLLVPSQKVAYNKAAGADFKEISLRSYVMGYYKAERSDSGLSTKPVALREAGTTISAILGVFRDDAFCQDVTLAQVFYQKEPSGQPQRFYIVADDVLSIAEDFSDFGGDQSSLRKRLKRRERLAVFDSFPEYGAAFQRRFGLRNKQAMELFHQTVSLKTVGNLTSFVQEHMLEPFDSQTHIDNLINHFEDLNRTHESILTAKAQIEKLTPLVEDFNRYNETLLVVDKKTSHRDNLKYFFAALKKGFLEELIGEKELHQEKLDQRIENSSKILRNLRSDRDSTTQAIAANGGSRLETIRNEMDHREIEKEEKQRRAEIYNSLAKDLGFPILRTIDQFSESRNSVTSKISEVTQERNLLEQKLNEHGFEFRDLKQNHERLEEELRSLKSRKSNIDTHQIEIRRRLCEELNLNAELLPFAGELIAVKPEEREWEGAIERVLRSFALSLLVPDSLYQRVSEWVDSTNLRGRLIYYRMGEVKPPVTSSSNSVSLINKISLKEESSYRAWVSQQIGVRFADFICCESLSQFRRVSKGLTRAGQVKGSAIYHEKDDRHDVNDRSRFVLGWINTAKIAALGEQRTSVEKKLQHTGDSIARIQKERTDLEDQLDRLKQLSNYSHFDELDWQPAVTRIEALKEEMRLLESNSDVLKTLKGQLDEIERRISGIENELYQLQKDQGGVDHDLDELHKSIAVEKELVNTCEERLEDITASIEPLLPTYLGEKKLNLRNCPSAEREFREKIQAEIDAAKKKLNRLQVNIISSMEGFRRDYPMETREMDASLESQQEYRNFLNTLEREDIPRFEQKFKKLLNENTIREIAGFLALLNKESHQIRERVEAINKSMYEIDYNKGRYIHLEAINTNDIDIKTFRQDLKSCVEGSFGTEEAEQYSETKFLQVKGLINRFKGREGYSDSDKKWTAKVTDVRSWFVFAASERWREDDNEFEHYTDSGGKSGGQKEKLAYTVLAASLAYQFGLDFGEVNSRSFRFVVIDEAFGRGSDESARYGLDLFKRLKLQLLIVTPLQKIHIIEPYVSSVGFVHNNPEGNYSQLRCLTIRQYQEEKEKRKQ